MIIFVKCYYEGHFTYCVGSCHSCKLKSAFIQNASLTPHHERPFSVFYVPDIPLKIHPKSNSRRTNASFHIHFNDDIIYWKLESNTSFILWEFSHLQ